MRHVVVALWLASVASGCALVGGAHDEPVAAPARDARNLRARLDEHVAVVAEGSIGDAFDARMLAALRSELMARGVTVVPSGEAELSLRLETRVQGAGYFIRGESILHVERPGNGSDQLATGNVTARDDRFVDESARALVTKLLRSPLLAGLGAPPPAGANEALDEAKKRARANAQRGTAHYNLDQFDKALPAYEAAYLDFQDPALLFNIAQCHRKLGHGAEAVAYYRKYLRNAPQAPNRAEVEKRIEELETAPTRAAARNR